MRSERGAIARILRSLFNQPAPAGGRMLAPGEASEPGVTRNPKNVSLRSRRQRLLHVIHKSPLSHCLCDERARAANHQDVAPSLEYLGGTVRALGGIALEINGTNDHVHILAKLRPTISVSEFLSKLKAGSSGWAKRQTAGRFGWQGRFGAFTVSESQVERVRRYIRNQQEHHRKQSFEEEFKALLRAHKIDFDAARF